MYCPCGAAPEQATPARAPAAPGFPAASGGPVHDADPSEADAYRQRIDEHAEHRVAGLARMESPQQQGAVDHIVTGARPWRRLCPTGRGTGRDSGAGCQSPCGLAHSACHIRLEYSRFRLESPRFRVRRRGRTQVGCRLRREVLRNHAGRRGRALRPRARGTATATTARVAAIEIVTHLLQHALQCNVIARQVMQFRATRTTADCPDPLRPAVGATHIEHVLGPHTLAQLRNNITISIELELHDRQCSSRRPPEPVLARPSIRLPCAVRRGGR